MNKEFPENWKSFDLEDICFFQEGPGLRQFQYHLYFLRKLYY